eukprot:c20759_g9_i2.p2 GENE.c20759_g9_i2~~c20759_g9_i2.p2  ORF type:complete len:398 (+),score=73.76 c20759_g9_i2:45-1238(+)
MTSSDVIVCVVTVIAVVLVGCLLIGFLWYRNKYGRVIKVSNAPPPKWYIRWTILFFKSILLELVSLVFTIFSIVGLETSDWKQLNIAPARISFYIFNVALKYLLLIANVVIENYFEEWPTQVAIKLRIRPDWMETLEGLIFVPCLLIDGVLLNAEYFLGSVGDVVDYDSVAMTLLDTLLFTKATVFALTDLHSERGRCVYDLIAIAYGMASYAYSMTLVFLFLSIHVDAVSSTGMAVTDSMAVVLVCILTHSYVSAYSSMVRQGIIALDRALKHTQFRVRQLRAFIVYFSGHWFWRLVTLLVYLFVLFIYIAVFVIAPTVSLSGRREGVLKGWILANLVLVLTGNCFYFVNLLFNVLKRMGAMFGWRYPFCLANVSAALSQAGVSINLDAHQRVGRI